MTTINGVIRSYGVAVRRAERENQRQAREAAKRFKAQQKLQDIENARQSVTDWANYVTMLQSIHKNCTEPIDWNQIKNIEKPTKPIHKPIKEKKVKYKIDNFKPSFFDKLFGLTQKKINKLNIQLSEAKKNDQIEFDSNYKDYIDELKNWEELQDIAKGIDNNNIDSYKEALDYFDPFSDIGELGVEMNLNFKEDHVDVLFNVNSTEIIPDYELKQTSTGKLSKKKMTKTKFNELYQDHVCSSVIRIARELFAYLPIKYVRVNAMSKLLNKGTGHLEEKPILSVIIPPETIEALNLSTIDPSDSMENFLHNMKFNKTNGFSTVDKVELVK